LNSLTSSEVYSYGGVWELFLTMIVDKDNVKILEMFYL